MRSFSAILLCVAALVFTVTATSEPVKPPTPEPPKPTPEEEAEIKKGREELKSYISKAGGCDDLTKENPDIENVCLNYSTALKSIIIAVKNAAKNDRKLYVLKDGKFKELSADDKTKFRKELLKVIKSRGNNHRNYHHVKRRKGAYPVAKKDLRKGEKRSEEEKKEEPKPEEKKEEPKPEEKKEEPKPEEKKEEPKPEEKKEEPKPEEKKEEEESYGTSS